MYRFSKRLASSMGRFRVTGISQLKLPSSYKAKEKEFRTLKKNLRVSDDLNRYAEKVEYEQ